MAVDWDGRYALDEPSTQACAKPQPGREHIGCELAKGHDGYHAVFLPALIEGEVPGTVAFERYERLYGTERAYYGDDGEVT